MPSANKKPLTRGAVEIATVRIELLGSKPLIWRQVEVPTSITLDTLHAIIQRVMPWEDDHLWEFTIGRQRISSRAGLRAMLKPRRTTFNYLYDFGDSWEHRITITDIRPSEPGVSYPRFVAGEHNAPPEDCGGIWGFYAKLEARDDPSNPDHDYVLEWFEDYDPNAIDVTSINARLAHIAA